MVKFCLHCGKMLRDEDQRCPDCGTPVDGSVAPPLQQTKPKSNDYKLKVMVIALVALIAIAIVATALPLWNQTSQGGYNVTVTVDSISVSDTAGQLHLDGNGNAPVYVKLGYASSSSSTSTNVDIPGNNGLWSCPTDGRAYSDLSGNEKTFKMTGSSISDYKFTLFLYDYNNPKISDPIDLFDDRNNVVGKDVPKVFGVSGISFSSSSITMNGDTGTITVSGDSDPIGSVTLTFTFTKI